MKKKTLKSGPIILNMINNALIKTGGIAGMQKRTYAPGRLDIAKIVQQSNRQGNPGIAGQQWTEREIFDYLPLDGRRQFTFFENVKTRQFPYTNLQENKLQAGEQMILKNIFFNIMVVNPLDPLEVTNNLTFSAAGLPGLQQNLWEFFNDNVRVVKSKGGLANTPQYNRNAFNANMNVTTLRSDITIPTLVEFTAQVLMPVYAAQANAFLGFHAEGIGTILNPKSVY